MCAPSSRGLLGVFFTTMQKSLASSSRHSCMSYLIVGRWPVKCNHRSLCLSSLALNSRNPAAARVDRRVIASKKNNVLSFDDRFLSNCRSLGRDEAFRTLGSSATSATSLHCRHLRHAPSWRSRLPHLKRNHQHISLSAYPL